MGKTNQWQADRAASQGNYENAKLEAYRIYCGELRTAKTDYDAASDKDNAILKWRADRQTARDKYAAALEEARIRYHDELTAAYAKAMAARKKKNIAAAERLAKRQNEKDRQRLAQAVYEARIAAYNETAAARRAANGETDAPFSILD